MKKQKTAESYLSTSSEILHQQPEKKHWAQLVLEETFSKIPERVNENSAKNTKRSIYDTRVRPEFITAGPTQVQPLDNHNSFMQQSVWNPPPEWMRATALQRERGWVKLLKDDYGWIRFFDGRNDLYFQRVHAPPQLSIGTEVEFTRIFSSQMNIHIAINIQRITPVEAYKPQNALHTVSNPPNLNFETQLSFAINIVSSVLSQDKCNARTLCLQNHPSEVKTRGVSTVNTTAANSTQQPSQTAAPTVSFACNICHKKFKGKEGMQSHKRIKHNKLQNQNKAKSLVSISKNQKNALNLGRATLTREVKENVGSALPPVPQDQNYAGVPEMRGPPDNPTLESTLDEKNTLVENVKKFHPIQQEKSPIVPEVRAFWDLLRKHEEPGEVRARWSRKGLCFLNRKSGPHFIPSHLIKSAELTDCAEMKRFYAKFLALHLIPLTALHNKTGMKNTLALPELQDQYYKQYNVRFHQDYEQKVKVFIEYLPEQIKPLITTHEGIPILQFPDEAIAWAGTQRLPRDFASFVSWQRRLEKEDKEQGPNQLRKKYVGHSVLAFGNGPLKSLGLTFLTNQTSPLYIDSSFYRQLQLTSRDVRKFYAHFLTIRLISVLKGVLHKESNIMNAMEFADIERRYFERFKENLLHSGELISFLTASFSFVRPKKLRPQVCHHKGRMLLIATNHAIQEAEKLFDYPDFATYLVSKKRGGLSLLPQVDAPCHVNVSQQFEETTSGKDTPEEDKLLSDRKKAAANINKNTLKCEEFGPIDVNEAKCEVVDGKTLQIVRLVQPEHKGGTENTNHAILHRAHLDFQSMLSRAGLRFLGYWFYADYPSPGVPLKLLQEIYAEFLAIRLLHLITETTKWQHYHRNSLDLSEIEQTYSKRYGEKLHRPSRRNISAFLEDIFQFKSIPEVIRPVIFSTGIKTWITVSDQAAAMRNKFPLPPDFLTFFFSTIRVKLSTTPIENWTTACSPLKRKYEDFADLDGHKAECDSETRACLDQAIETVNSLERNGLGFFRKLLSAKRLGSGIAVESIKKHYAEFVVLRFISIIAGETEDQTGLLNTVTFKRIKLLYTKRFNERLQYADNCSLDSFLEDLFSTVEPMLRPMICDYAVTKNYRIKIITITDQAASLASTLKLSPNFSCFMDAKIDNIETCTDAASNNTSRAPPSICKFFNQGKCTNAENCLFLHLPVSG